MTGSTGQPDAAVADPAGARAGRFPVPVSLPVASVVAAVLVLAVAAAVTFGMLLSARSSADRAGTEALATARAYAVTATSYDYQHLDQDFAAVLDGATGDFKNEYASATEPLRQLVTQAKASATGTVVAAGIQSRSTGQVVVVALVDQSVSNAGSTQPSTAHNRLIMTLVPDDGRWLVSKLELV